jgi:hypothetical protein
MATHISHLFNNSWELRLPLYPCHSLSSIAALPLNLPSASWLSHCCHGPLLPHCCHGALPALQVKLDPRFVSGDTPPLSCRAFLLRLLNNLKQVYITLNMAEEALAIVRYA